MTYNTRSVTLAHKNAENRVLRTPYSTRSVTFRKDAAMERAAVMRVTGVEITDTPSIMVMKFANDFDRDPYFIKIATTIFPALVEEKGAREAYIIGLNRYMMFWAKLLDGR